MKIGKKYLLIFSPRNVMLVLLTICALFSIFTLFIAKVYLNSYKLLLERELVAIVECAKDSQSDQTFLNIEFYPNTDMAKKQTFNFTANEWIIESRIIKWKPLLGFFGMQRYYKLERLSGRYLDINQERNLPRQVYNIAEKPDALWAFLYKYNRCFPFIDAVYGNSAFIQYELGAQYYVYMTSTGLMIKNVTLQKKRNWWFTG
jgi:hypothetical protein